MGLYLVSKVRKRHRVTYHDPAVLSDTVMIIYEIKAYITENLQGFMDEQYIGWIFRACSS